MPTVRWAHTAEEDRWWVENILLPQEEVWVAETDGVVLGFLALHHDEHGDCVSQCYVAPGHWRQGHGSALLEHAKMLRPGGLRLWCFQVNAPARAFYERHGFEVARFTDGADNEECEPDILYVWTPDRPAVSQA
jgi:GNAT superfamily N-acetyltransferase